MSARPPAVLSHTSSVVLSFAPARRRKAGVAYAEGARVVEMALAGAWDCKALIVLDSSTSETDVQTSIQKARRKQIPVHHVSARALEKLTSLEAPPPVGIIVCPPRQALREPQSVPTRILVLDRVADPGNAGTLIRSAVAFGFTTLLTEGSVGLTNEKMIRASAGACFGKNAVVAGGIATEVASLLKRAKAEIVCLMPRAERTLGDLHPARNKPIALVLGSEAGGLDAAAWPDALACRIPMRGGIESLNVAMCGAIAMYELSRGLGK